MKYAKNNFGFKSKRHKVFIRLSISALMAISAGAIPFTVLAASKATVLPAVAGVCGAANGVAQTAAPTTDLAAPALPRR